jgi:glutathionylspermidine synthase
MTLPWIPVELLTPLAFARVRRRAIFDCHKWDPQVGDAGVIARCPLILHQEAWNEVAGLAETLAAETLAAEAEIARRPELHAHLGLPRAVRRALRHAAGLPSPGAARIVRFDFHFTTEGWRISEANADVPGGLNEASGFAAIMGPHFPWARPVGDPAAAYVESIAAAAGSRGTVALVHATAYSDDQQMMTFVAERLHAAGLRPHLASPDHLRFHDGRASLEAAWFRGPLDLVVRFFPAEWLGALPRASGWPHLFGTGRTPLSNPATAILVQSKRWPLIWNRLDTPVPVWRALLPETRESRDVPWRTSRDWVLKPALGRVGEGVGLADCIGVKDLRAIARSATWQPGHWVAQRRFDTMPVCIGGAPVYPCLGVYTVDGRVAGGYGRLAPRPLIDARAEDAAVMVA